MAIKNLKKIVTKQSELYKLQENVEKFTKQINSRISDGILISEVSIGTTVTMVPHGLARPYQGWQLVDILGDARVWRDNSLDFTKNENSKSKFIGLKASSPVTVQLWVF